MSIFELSGKVVESAANLNEKKLEIAIDLLKFYYDKKDNPIQLDVVLKDYNYIYDELKNLKSSEDTGKILQQNKQTFKILLGIIILFLLVFSFIIYNVGIQKIIAYLTN